ncbi:AAA family ATPase [Mycolicibacterium sp. XJ662]
MEGSVYTPGAGHSPRVLAGRDALLQDFELMLNDVSVQGRVRAQDIILAGPRGVGKTVTVTAYGTLASSTGYEVVNLQAVAGQAGLVDSLLHRATGKLQAGAGPWQRAKKAFDRLAGVSVGAAGFSAGFTTRSPEAGRLPATDAGTLAEALLTVAAEVRRDRPNGGLLITLDELQVASPADLALLAATLHRLNVDHPEAAVVFTGTGLPHTPEALRKAGVTHPDRLFMLEPLPLTLKAEDAAYAVVEPARRIGISWQPEAVERIVTASNGYPAHLQLFAHATWTIAPGPSVITLADVEKALPRAAAQLEQRSLGPRWDRMPDRQMEFLAALALCGGRATTAQLARILGRTSQELSWIRQALIEEGDVFAPKRGQLCLTVPLMAPFVLARYEQARRDTGDDVILSLEAMRNNGGMGTPALRSDR